MVNASYKIVTNVKITVLHVVHLKRSAILVIRAIFMKATLANVYCLLLMDLATITPNVQLMAIM